MRFRSGCAATRPVKQSWPRGEYRKQVNPTYRRLLTFSQSQKSDRDPRVGYLLLSRQTLFNEKRTHFYRPSICSKSKRRTNSLISADWSLLTAHCSLNTRKAIESSGVRERRKAKAKERTVHKSKSEEKWISCSNIGEWKIDRGSRESVILILLFSSLLNKTFQK